MVLLVSRATLEPNRNERADRREIIGIADILEASGYDRLAKRLRTCGSWDPGELGPGARRWPHPCNIRFCPPCQARLETKRFLDMRPKVQETLGWMGGAAFLTLNAPSSTGTILERLSALRAALDELRKLQAWKRTGGFKDKVGVVVSTEISLGDMNPGHPHLHVFICGPDQHVVDQVAHWLLQGWVERTKGTTLAAQRLETMGVDPDDWGPRLRYLFKGSQPRLAWPEPVLLEAVDALTSGRQFIQVLGLLRSARRGGCSGKAPTEGVFLRECRHNAGETTG